MNVTLLSYTPDALDILLMTKQTRLALEPGLLEEIRNWPPEKKQAELDYMRGTIQSSWEFVDYTFLITEVSRAFTHQLVRSRANSYAQQSQRTVDMSGFEYTIPPAFGGDQCGDSLVLSTGEYGLSFEAMTEAMRQAPELLGPHSWYDWAMLAAEKAYREMLAMGANPQDARGVLPTNICTNIVVKASLRSLADAAKIRLCTRTQGEYQTVFRAMRDAVIAIHPWAEPFIRVACAATGVCAFPNYHECPIKGPLFNPDTGYRWDEKSTERTHNVYLDRNGNALPETVVAKCSFPAPPRTREEQQTAWEAMDLYEAVPKGVPRAEE